MGLFEKIAELAPPLIVSAIVASMVMVGVFVLTIFIGAKLFSDELSYGVPLALGYPLAFVAGALAFVWLFRKMRSLD